MVNIWISWPTHIFEQHMNKKGSTYEHRSRYKTIINIQYVVDLRITPQIFYFNISSFSLLQTNTHMHTCEYTKHAKILIFH